MLRVHQPLKLFTKLEGRSFILRGCQFSGVRSESWQGYRAGGYWEKHHFTDRPMDFGIRSIGGKVQGNNQYEPLQDQRILPTSGKAVMSKCRDTRRNWFPSISSVDTARADHFNRSSVQRPPFKGADESGHQRVISPQTVFNADGEAE